VSRWPVCRSFSMFLLYLRDTPVLAVCMELHPFTSLPLRWKLRGKQMAGTDCDDNAQLITLVRRSWSWFHLTHTELRVCCSIAMHYFMSCVIPIRLTPRPYSPPGSRLVKFQETQSGITIVTRNKASSLSSTLDILAHPTQFTRRALYEQTDLRNVAQTGDCAGGVAVYLRRFRWDII
jgi:hypothetical protein